ncbi:reverse transcriptase domain-containing protein [Ornatilinea apprima]|uniref:reverse transcriptase domain-containing protein n=1 Tax=Ornatilinea apprima TaxID=1134406 RepID=UPI0009466CA5|nr:reverse transcriptase domain-containing protein [Ornatilinea apprima]
MSQQKNLLAQVLQMDNLCWAWEEIAENKGIPGVDNISIARWRRNWEERLVQLARDVRGSAYLPKPLRLRRIPKRNRSQYRVLRIPTVTDRVLQRAVLQVLQPHYERIFLECSYGYRPWRGLKDAVQRIIILREQNFRWVLDADIDDFFNRVNHALLMKFLEDDLPDSSLNHLIARWLRAGNREMGIPMGSPLSPLLANVFLHRLDQSIQQTGVPLVRYADDFIVLTCSEQAALLTYHRVGQFLKDLELSYEPAKTSITSFEQGFTFIGVRFLTDSYSYTWEDKEITVNGDEVDWLFSQYGPEYE